MAGVKRPRAMLDLSDRLLEGRYSEPPAIRRAVDSSDGKTRTPSPTLTPLTGEIPSFGPNASVVFVGIRGTGKSTLAIMASSAMKRKVLDLETAFQRSSGMSSASYKSIHGSAQCHHQQAKILQGVLDRNRSDAVIVCSWMESRVQELLRHFAATNPVIHVVRDAEAIQEHLKVRDAKKMENLINVSKVIFRSCANFELFNVSERPRDTSAPASPNAVFQRLPAPYLTLKQAERHLLKFLSLIYPPGAIPFIESAFPLANMATEDRRFTYALSLPLRELKSANFDLEEHVTGADAIQIHVEGLDSQSDEKSADLFMSLASDITRGVGMVRRAAILPIAVHVELPENMTDSVVRLYTDLVSHALRLAPEMITLDLRLQDTVISQFVADNGRSRIVANRIFTTSEAPSWESSTWTSLYRRACQLGCDMVRLVRPALSIDDNFAINSFKQAVKSLDCIHIPLISYNSGSIGRHSAVFNQILTPVKSISWPSPELDTSPLPCISALDATKALCSSFIYDPMRLYVFGVQVDYSMSPAMHNSALRACGLHFQYEPHSTDSLNGIRHMIEDPLFGGASIGLPFKVEVITLTMEMSRHAKAIGAVNTLIPLRNLSEDGSLPPSSKFYSNIGRAGPVRALYGDNTDWIGIKQCIRRGLSPANAVKPATCGVVIGAGGMSRAAVYSMLQLGIQNIVIFNRTTSNAEALATHFRQLMQRPDFQSLGGGSHTKFYVIASREDPWPPHFSLPTIIVSCIPTHRIGNTPAPDFTVPEEWLGSRTGGVVVEFGYKSLNTPLLAQAKREAHRGWVAMDGLDILPEQGYAQFELFTGRRAPRRIMRRDLLRFYTDEQGRAVDDLQSRIRSEVDPEA